MRNVESIEVGYGEALQFGVSQGTYYKEPEQLLTEAYEAGKREQADELEAARAEIERKMSAGQFVLEQLAAEQAKNVKLLDFIARAQVSSGVCCCGEPMDGHSSPMSCGHSPVDAWDYAVWKLLDAQPDTYALEAMKEPE